MPPPCPSGSCLPVRASCSGLQGKHLPCRCANNHLWAHRIEVAHRREGRICGSIFPCNCTKSSWPHGIDARLAVGVQRCWAGRYGVGARTPLVALWGDDKRPLVVRALRDQNKVAHALAHLGIRSGQGRVYFPVFQKRVSFPCLDTLYSLFPFLKKKQS